MGAKQSNPKKRFDCLKCPAYCCSYDDILITITDLKRIAKHLKIPFAKAKKLYTRTTDGKLYLKEKKDKHFGQICVFVHSVARICTLYNHRPKVCRDYPYRKYCGYFDMLTFERSLQQDDEYVVQVKR
jgi:uncharacterized protein